MANHRLGDMATRGLGDRGRLRISVLSASLLAFFLVCQAPANAMTTNNGGKAVVSLIDDVELSSGTIVLGSLARIESRDLDLNLRLASVEVATAPRPGRSIHVGRARLELALIRAGLWDRVRLDGALRVRVHRSAQGLKGAQIAEAAEAALKKALSNDPPDRLDFKSIGGVRDLQVSPGRVELRAQPPALGSHSLIRIPVEVWVSGRQEARVLVTAGIKIWRPTLVAKRNIRRGDFLKAEDLETRVMDVIPLGSQRPDALDDILGLVARVPLPRGEPVLASSLAQPQVVRQGDRLWVHGRVGTIRVQARVRALEGGAVGDGIRVQNVSSGKKLKARIVGPGLASVLR